LDISLSLSLSRSLSNTPSLSVLLTLSLSLSLSPSLDLSGQMRQGRRCRRLHLDARREHAVHPFTPPTDKNGLHPHHAMVANAYTLATPSLSPFARARHSCLLGVDARGGLVFKAHRWLYHPILGSRVMNKKKKKYLDARREHAVHPLDLLSPIWPGVWGGVERQGRAEPVFPLALSLVSLPLPNPNPNARRSDAHTFAPGRAQGARRTPASPTRLLTAKRKG